MTEIEHSRVRRLSPTLANQIAAGEVVERPASVIKELLENSIDAGARRLDIDIEQGGISLIKVRDDGCGIRGDDLVLALSRHATSKVATLDDLETVDSLGFRGEALPSVASVARVEICSRTVVEDVAWKLTVEGSEVRSEAVPASHPTGTTVTVRDLFFNTPARRKFLRTEKTELRHIEDVIKRVALSRFDLEVRFTHNARTVWILPSTSSEGANLRRLSKLCGSVFCDHALQVEFDSDEMRLSGWLGMPGYGRRQTDLQYFFLNGRMVRDRVVTHAIRQAYENDLPPGTHPAFILYLQMDPAGVDVNVHPAKHEVRFRDSRSIHDFLFRTANRALSEHRHPELGVEDAVPTSAAVAAYHPMASTASTIAEQSAVYRQFGQTHRNAGEMQRLQNPGRLGTPVSVVGGVFLITEHEQSLIVIDMLKARTYIAYVCLRREHTEGKVRSRPLLLPSHHTVSETHATLFEEGARLKSLGLDIRRVGPHTVSLRDIPLALEQADASSVIGAAIECLSPPNKDVDALLDNLSGCLSQGVILTDPSSVAALLGTMESMNIEPPHPPICRRLDVQELGNLLEEKHG